MSLVTNSVSKWTNRTAANGCFHRQSIINLHNNQLSNLMKWWKLFPWVQSVTHFLNKFSSQLPWNQKKSFQTWVQNKLHVPLIPLKCNEMKQAKQNTFSDITYMELWGNHKLKGLETAPYIVENVRLNHSSLHYPNHCANRGSSCMNRLFHLTCAS